MGSAALLVLSEVLRYSVQAEPFTVELTLPDGTKQTSRPRRQAAHFYFDAEKGWPIPDGPESKRVRCEIRWNGFPYDWRLVNSFGVDQRVQAFQTTLGELRKAVFAGGDYRISRSERGLVLVTRAAWRFPDADVLTLMDRISEAQTAVWRDRGLSGHIVFLLATVESGGQGEARTNATELEFSPSNLEKALDLAKLLAHELFHEWNPRRLNRPEDERLYWFTEGVTDYYAALTLLRTGIWDFKRFVDSFNTTARIYFGSPARNLTADRMVAERQSDSNAERLPYLQGYLLASQWNTGGHTLDQAMRKLKRSNRMPLSNERIAAALPAAGGDIERFVVRGETIVIRPRLFGDCASESKAEVRRFEIGFDLSKSRAAGTIHGISEDSNAWRAGIRDGQRWQPMDVVWGDPGYLAEIEIRDGQGMRRVKYYPATSTGIQVPQYNATVSACVIP